jgi:pimeloyl-ACP methyl ester carboxylesterase
MPNMPFIPPMPPPDITHAIVVDKGSETAYRRSGRGEPVLVLASSDSPVSSALFGALARNHLVVTPSACGGEAEVATRGSSFAGWLRGFLDALGLSRISIVADETAGAAALGFALLEPFRVARVALLLATPPGETPHTMSDVLQDARVPLLTVWHAHDDGESVVGEIVEFLSLCPD